MATSTYGDSRRRFGCSRCIRGNAPTEVVSLRKRSPSHNPTDRALLVLPVYSPTDNLPRTGIKEYSDWPTIPQLYVDGEFVGGCDILINMHKDGSLAKLLSEKKVIVEEDAEPEPDDVEGQKAEEVRETTEQSTGGRSKDAKGESS